MPDKSTIGKYPSPWAIFAKLLELELHSSQEYGHFTNWWLVQHGSARKNCYVIDKLYRVNVSCDRHVGKHPRKESNLMLKEKTDIQDGQGHIFILATIRMIFAWMFICWWLVLNHTHSGKSFSQLQQATNNWLHRPAAQSAWTSLSASHGSDCPTSTSRWWDAKSNKIRGSTSS